MKEKLWTYSLVFSMLIIIAGLVFTAPVFAGKDRNPPTVTAFDLPATSNSLTVPILVFTAIDGENGISGYMVTETSAKPGKGDAGWNASPSAATHLTSGARRRRRDRVTFARSASREEHDDDTHRSR